MGLSMRSTCVLARCGTSNTHTHMPLLSALTAARRLSWLHATYWHPGWIKGECRQYQGLLLLPCWWRWGVLSGTDSLVAVLKL